MCSRQRNPDSGVLLYHLPRVYKETGDREGGRGILISIASPCLHGHTDRVAISPRKRTVERRPQGHHQGALSDGPPLVTASCPSLVGGTCQQQQHDPSHKALV